MTREEIVAGLRHGRRGRRRRRRGGGKRAHHRGGRRGRRRPHRHLLDRDLPDPRRADGARIHAVRRHERRDARPPPGVVGRAGAVPVIAGLGAHDPRRPIDRLVGAAIDGGAAGLTNEPFVGIYTPEMRADLDAAGYGFGREVAMLAEARRRGMTTLGWAFDEEEVRTLIGAGVDVIGAMAGSPPAGPADAAGGRRSSGSRRGDRSGPRAARRDRRPPRGTARGPRDGRQGARVHRRGRLRDGIERRADTGPRGRPRHGRGVPLPAAPAARPLRGPPGRRPDPGQSASVERSPGSSPSSTAFR